MALVSLSIIELCSSNPIISASDPPVDLSTYESLYSMVALSPSNVVTTDVESGDNEEIFEEEMAYS